MRNWSARRARLIVQKTNQARASFIFYLDFFFGRLFFVFDFVPFLRFAIIALMDFEFNALLLCDAVNKLGMAVASLMYAIR
jgi:hypothetical protein